jgi:hypothetical protein
MEVKEELYKRDDSELMPKLLKADRPEEVICEINCEDYILKYKGFKVNIQQLIDDTEELGWVGNFPFDEIGKLSEKHGLYVKRRYKATLEEINHNIARGRSVMAVVNAQDLKGNEIPNKETPNHTVVVLCVSNPNVLIYNPTYDAPVFFCPVSRFLEAWEDSGNFIAIFTDLAKEYHPDPVDVSDVKLNSELLELCEVIAENAHEIWSDERMKEDWTYGPVRNDTLKQNPDLVPYIKLPESEKEYDRKMAMKTIMLLDKLGWEIRKKD